MRHLLALVPLLLATPALAKPAATDWMGKAAVFTNADVVNGRGATLAPAVKGALPETLNPQSVSITMVDKQGLTQVEVFCTSTAMYELQNGSEFSRRSALGGTHAAVFAALRGKPAAADAPVAKATVGLFNRVEAPASAGEKMVSEFLASREASDVVVTLGWSTKEGPAIYATLYADRIEMNVEAPKAKK